MLIKSLLSRFSSKRLLNLGKCLSTVAERSHVVNPSIIVAGSNKIIESNHGIVNFSPRGINVEIGYTNSRKPPIMETPKNIIRLPITPNILSILDDLTNERSVQLPETPNNAEKLALNMIRIRRKKMKKHKLRKLRKRMKYKWAKVRQARELKRERMFLGDLVAQVKEAENFSAEQYVTEKLNTLHHKGIPNVWKGKKLPRFIVRQLMGIDKKINYKGIEPTGK